MQLSSANIREEMIFYPLLFSIYLLLCQWLPAYPGLTCASGFHGICLVLLYGQDSKINGVS